MNIECRDMKHFVEQMVLIAKELDIDYEAMRRQIESTPLRKPADSEHVAVQSAPTADTTPCTELNGPL